MTLLAIALVLIVGGGTAAVLLSFVPRAASAVAVLGMVAGAVLGEVRAIDVLLGAHGDAITLPWPVPYGLLRADIDPLSAFFLVPLFLLAALAAVYGRDYWQAHSKRAKGSAWLAFNLLVASMVVVVTARHSVLFLVAWEIMSLAAYFLVTLDHQQEEVRRAGFTYLIATHIATAFLLVLFLLLGRHAQSFDFEDIANVPTPAGLSLVVLALTLVGFGVKAGFVPLHVWLPEAHAAAPSHVSALMSGVMIKMGLYGLLRIFLLLGRPGAYWGPVLMGIGLTGALFGISLALYQRDMKRVLAYSSIENVGLIALGLGTGLWGFSSGNAQVAALGTTGALLHVWNHTVMKGLMFLGAGSVLSGCHSKDLEQLGGVIKRMPWTSGAMLAGAVAMAGLPPMNGFVSEWLIYLALIYAALGSTGAAGVAAFLAVGVVALVGGLALLCFARFVGIALLGQPRSEHASCAHESPSGMTVPLALLAVLAAGLALAPVWLARAASSVSSELLRMDTTTAIPGAWLSGMGWLNAVLWLVIGAALLLGHLVAHSSRAAIGETWGCAYAQPSPRMQYSARSFSEQLSERLLPKSLRAHVSLVAPAALFPSGSSLSSECVDPLTRAIYEPFIERWGNRFARLRWLQQGILHIYLFYIVATAVGALAWTSVSTWIGR